LLFKANNDCYIRVHCRRYASNDGRAWVDALSPSPPQDIKNTSSSEHDLSKTSSPSLLLEVEELYNIATGKVRPYILAGDITHFPLTYIFVLIQKTKKSGKLTIKIKDYEEIEIFFIQGVMVHAVDKESKGEEVVRKAIKLRKGHFIFDSETVTFELTIKRPLESIIQDDKPEK